MDSRKYSVFNRTRESFLSSSVTQVNAALEPLKVLKVLIEGLPANARTGLWLTNFKGVPVARTLSPFDLIYLDKDLRIAHSVELSKDGEFAPFKGQPASALVLPPRSITSSRSRDGDDLDLQVIESTRSEPEGVDEAAGAPQGPVAVEQVPLPPTPSSVRFYASATASLRPAASDTPLERFGDDQTSSPATAAEAPETLQTQAPQTAAQPAPVTESAPPTEDFSATPPPSPSSTPVPLVQGKRRRLITGPILTAPAPEGKKSAAADPPGRAKAPIPFPQTPAAKSAIPTIQEAPVTPLEPPIHLSPQQRTAPRPQEEHPADPPAASLPVPAVRPARLPAVPGPTPALPRATPVSRAPVPAAAPPAESAPPTHLPAEPVLPPPPLHVPGREPIPDYRPGPRNKYSWKVRALRWLFPELIIQEAPKQRDRRRADRQSLPGLIAYFFTGGAPVPQKINNISVTGFYLETDDRWMPGTVVRMTLQKMGSKGDDPTDTITVNSRIVRWGPDGEGFEFILTDLDE
jgi:hypothetical protein